MALDSDERTLYIGNLDKNVSEDVLYELFLQAGPIERVNIVNSNDSFSFGFITYKHDVSIDYAIQLYKGIKLFHKELSIKKKGKSNNNCQQSNNYNKYGSTECNTTYKQNFDMMQISQDQLHNGIQNFKLNIHSVIQPFTSNKSNFSESYRSSGNKPYDRNTRDDSRSRRRHKDKLEGNKFYQNKKSRY